jgi:hypothetical protein
MKSLGTGMEKNSFPWGEERRSRPLLTVMPVAQAEIATLSSCLKELQRVMRKYGL